MNEIVIPDYVAQAGVTALVGTLEKDTRFQESNHNGEIVVVQINETQDKVPMVTERARPVTVRSPVTFSELTQELRRQKWKTYVIVENDKNVFVRLLTRPKVMEVVFVEELGVHGQSKINFFGEDYSFSTQRESHLYSVSKPCVNARVYHAVLNRDVDLYIPFDTEEQAKDACTLIDKADLMFVSGMRIPTRQWDLKKKVRVAGLMFVASDYWLKEDMFDDVAEIMPKINSYDDVSLFRNVVTGEVIYPDYVNTLLWWNLFYVRIGDPVFNLILAGVPGVAKCHGKGTEVLMFDGSLKKVEDVVVGDKLMGDDSKPRNVSSITSGKERLYKVNQTKGEPYVVNESHILSLRMSGSNGTKTYGGAKPGEVIDIPLVDYLKKNEGFKWHAKGYKVPVEFKSKPVKLDPYWLGVWLGDGDSNRACITTADVEIESAVRKFAKSRGIGVKKILQKDNKSYLLHLSNGLPKKGSWGMPNPVIGELRSLGVLNNKHIPKVYKINSREVRLQVLAGLIDTDGYVFRKQQVTIVQKNKVLAEDILFLSRSLGFAANMVEVNNRSQNGTQGKYYRVSLHGATEKIPCKVLRKQCVPRAINKNPLNTGIALEDIGVGEYYGFTIDGNHRYLLKDFTVTHNTHCLDMYAKIFADEGRMLGEGGTMKGMIPSFSGDEPKLGALASAKFFVAVDEFFKSPGSTAAKQGIAKESGSYNQYLRDLLPVISRIEKVYASAKDTNFTVLMKASLLGTDNIKTETTRALEVLLHDDPAVLRRFIVVYLDTDVWRKVKSAQPANSEENIAFLNDYFSKKGFSTKMLKRLAMYLRNATPKIRCDGPRVMQCVKDVFIEEATKKFHQEHLPTARFLELAEQLCMKVDFMPHFQAMVRCSCAMRTIFSHKESSLPISFTVIDEDYFTAGVVFASVLRSEFFLFSDGISQLLESGGLLRT